MASLERTDLESLRQRLMEAKTRSRDLARLGPGSAAWRDAREDELRLERELAAAQRLEYAESFDFEVPWDIGAPLPHLVAGIRIFLAFYVRQPPHAAWDGTSVTVVTPQAAKPVGLVEFVSPVAVKMGEPNDEALRGHPLYGRGLEAYRAHIVRDSSWIAELERINSVHPAHKLGSYEELTHYFFCFHDQVFECVAKAYNVELRNTSMAEALRYLASLMHGHEVEEGQG